jgi:hypothetical protein
MATNILMRISRTQLYSTAKLVGKNDGEHNTDPRDVLKMLPGRTPTVLQIILTRFYVVSLSSFLFTFHVFLSHRLSQLLNILKVNEPKTLIVNVNMVALQLAMFQ